MDSWIMISAICVFFVIAFIVLSSVFYRQFFKRFYDVLLSGMALFLLSPLFLVLTVLGAIKMKGSPFFLQERPGKHERIFKLIKFRSMTNERDSRGNLLPDEDRLGRYGRILRATSLDELPELVNIFKGDMSIIGPRPLLVRYLPYYTEKERHRHDILPGLTGFAQVKGRNFITWEETFALDLEYVNHYSLYFDINILLMSVLKVIRREDVSDATGSTLDSSGRRVHDSLDVERSGKA